MKYIISTLVGAVVGACIFLMLLYVNPMGSINSLSPLSLTDKEVITLGYSAVAQDTLIFTNDGESQIDPYPPKVPQLWERPIKRTSAMVTVLTDGRGQAAGIGIKISSDSERTSVLSSEALVDSVWHVVMPERGSFFIEQTENYWGYLHEIVVPARWSSGDNWRGTWYGNITFGPGALGIAKVVGGSGELQGLTADAVESLTAKAYSVEQGPVAMTGQLTIELPTIETETAAVTKVE
jgi:hypothetical protein